MGNYRSRREGFLAAWQYMVADLMFQGYTDEAICQTIWNVGDDKKKMLNARNKIRRLTKNPKFEEYYRSLVTEWHVHNVGKALMTIAKGMDDPNPWMANKAANDILSKSSRLMSMDENTVVVRVEGMPELGEPGADDDEENG